MVTLELLEHSVQAQQETAPTKHGERKCLHILIIHYKLIINRSENVKR